MLTVTRPYALFSGLLVAALAVSTIPTHANDARVLPTLAGVWKAQEMRVPASSELDQQVWGQGFPPPVFCDEFRVVSQRILKDKHLKLLLERNGQRYDAIWFGHNLTLAERARVAFRLDANEYNGVTKVQLMVEHAEDA